MEKFCIISNQEKDVNLHVTQKIINYLKKNNRSCFLATSIVDEHENHFTDHHQIPDDVECIIVLGGDGTIIQAADDLIGRGLPLIGINMGTLGFLAEIETHSIEFALDCLMQDNYRLEQRQMLLGTIYSNKEKVYAKEALNDVVITRAGFSRIITVEIMVNEEMVSKYRGDGVIIATPTGSTGYNLSAGGPVIKPDTQAIIITPICPHSLNARSIIVSAKDRVQIRIGKSKKTQEEEAIATFDGRTAIKLHTQDVIEIQKAREDTQLIKLSKNSFFDILRTKIGEGGE